MKTKIYSLLSVLLVALTALTACYDFPVVEDTRPQIQLPDEPDTLTATSAILHIVVPQYIERHGSTNRLWYSTDSSVPSNSGITAVYDKNTLSFRCQLSNLQPATTYYYYFDCDGFKSEIRNFTTTDRLPQTITWNMPQQEYHVGDTVQLKVNVSTGLAATFYVKEGGIVKKIQNDRFLIIDAGTASFVALQAGNAEYLEADSTIITIEATYPSSRNTNGFNYVDLGLPSGVLWCASNLKSYYQWSCPYSCSDFWYTNLTTNKNIATLRAEGYIDDDNNLTPRHDAARYAMGGTWRTPTQAEFQELLEYCRVTKKGWVVSPLGIYYDNWDVTGPNNNTISFSANGLKFGEGKYSSYSTTNAYYWTATACDDTNTAYVFHLEQYGEAKNGLLVSLERDCGCCLHAVID